MEAASEMKNNDEQFTTPAAPKERQRQGQQHHWQDVVPSTVVDAHRIESIPPLPVPSLLAKDNRFVYSQVDPDILTHIFARQEEAARQTETERLNARRLVQIDEWHQLIASSAPISSTTTTPTSTPTSRTSTSTSTSARELHQAMFGEAGVTKRDMRRKKMKGGRC